MISRTTTLAATLLLALFASGRSPHLVQGDPESWVVMFQSRSFDLQEFRTAVRRGETADRLAAITADLQQRVLADQSAFVAALQQIGGSVHEQWWLINGCAVDIPAGTSAALAALPGVASIEADSGLSPGAHRATDEFNHAAQTAHRLGYTGEGVGLAIMDTGQDSNCNGQNRPHRLYYPDGDPTKMTGRGIAGSRLERNLQLGAMPADDQLGHGTAVAALAAGAAWGAPGAHHGHGAAVAVLCCLKTGVGFGQIGFQLFGRIGGGQRGLLAGARIVQLFFER